MGLRSNIHSGHTTLGQHFIAVIKNPTGNTLNEKNTHKQYKKLPMVILLANKNKFKGISENNNNNYLMKSQR